MFGPDTFASKQESSYPNTMNHTEFEKHIKETIDERLFIENTPYEDIMRINIDVQGKGPITVCAFPKAGVREEFDPGYQSMHGAAFPHRELLEAKVRNFVHKLPENLELYD